MSGRFITFEGGEGSGKSTQIALLANRLRSDGKSVVTTREPGGSAGAEEIRSLLVRGAPERWDPITELLLVTAARSDHVARCVKPALALDHWVLCDRFVDSTVAYQGVAGGLGRHTVDRVTEAAIGSFGPDLTIVLDLDPAVGLARAAQRETGASGNATVQPAEHRFEQKPPAFHALVRQAFLDIAADEPNRIHIVNAAASQDDVHQQIWEIVAGDSAHQGRQASGAAQLA